MVSSSGWVMSTSHSASHQRLNSAASPWMRETIQAITGAASVRQEQRMALGAVARHVEDGVAVVDEGVEVGQGAADGAPQRGFPHRRAPAHHGHADGGAQGNLRE